VDDSGPESLTVADNPTIAEYQGHHLAGQSKMDEDGMLSREVRLVENGILKTMLMSRDPVRGFDHTTGSRHAGQAAPSNVIVTSSAGLSAADLHAKFIELVKQRNRPFGIVVRRLRTANNIVLAYKVFPDGREELVRGLQFVGMNPAAFKDIVAASKEPNFLTVSHRPSQNGAGMMMSFGSEESATPVSLVVPSLLFEDATMRKLRVASPNPPVAVASKPPSSVDPPVPPVPPVLATPPPVPTPPVPIPPLPAGTSMAPPAPPAPLATSGSPSRVRAASSLGFARSIAASGWRTVSGPGESISEPTSGIPVAVSGCPVWASAVASVVGTSSATSWSPRTLVSGKTSASANGPSAGLLSEEPSAGGPANAASFLAEARSLFASNEHPVSVNTNSKEIDSRRWALILWHSGIVMSGERESHRQFSYAS